MTTYHLSSSHAQIQDAGDRAVAPGTPVHSLQKRLRMRPPLAADSKEQGQEHKTGVRTLLYTYSALPGLACPCSLLTLLACLTDRSDAARPTTCPSMQQETTAGKDDVPLQSKPADMFKVKGIELPR